jgi:putative ABC transport system permease protein
MVKDFNFQSLHSQIEPLILYVNKHPYYADFLSVKLTLPDIRQSVELLTSEWKKFNPEKPFEFHFLDEELAKLYKAENKVSEIFNLLAVISIFISCLGLFGLSAFMAEKRTKEFGIRKVMGAGIVQILTLQSREFVMLTVIANIFVWPSAWWWASRWLSGFAFHIEINPLLFTLPLGIALILVLLTLLYHALKVARANPIQSLREE